MLRVAQWKIRYSILLGETCDDCAIFVFKTLKLARHLQDDIYVSLPFSSICKYSQVLASRSHIFAKHSRENVKTIVIYSFHL